MAVAGSTYIVQEGDTLWSIAQRAYGNGASYGLIAKENRIQDSNLIFTGTTLRLPRPPGQTGALPPSSSPANSAAARRGGSPGSTPIRQTPMPLPLRMPPACSIALPAVKYSGEKELFRLEQVHPRGRITLTVTGTLEMQLCEAQTHPISVSVGLNHATKAKYDSALAGIGAEFDLDFIPDRGFQVSSSLLISQTGKVGDQTIICQKTGYKPPNTFMYEAEPREVAAKFVPKDGGTPVWVKGNITVRVEVDFVPEFRFRLAPLFAPSPVPVRMTERPGPAQEIDFKPSIGQIILGAAIVVTVIYFGPKVLAFLLSAGVSLVPIAATAAVLAIALGPNKFLVPAEVARQHGPAQY